MPFPLFAERGPTPLFPGAVLLRRWCATGPLLEAIAAVVAQSPFRQMETPQGRMSAAITCCGQLGWTSDRTGYRYLDRDPLSGRPWPALPLGFAALASQSAVAAGFPPMAPDSCVINRYVPGSQMGAHRDRNERDFDWPIVSVSIGLPIRFYFQERRARSRAAGFAETPAANSPPATTSFSLEDGDVLVWGGPARLLHHGVRPLAAGHHPLAGALRYNLTFRVAG